MPRYDQSLLLFSCFRFFRNTAVNPIILIFFLFFLYPFAGVGQANIKAAAQLITTADSVVLISHLTTEENHDKLEALIVLPGTVGDTKPIVYPSFFEGQKINPAIVVQRQLLPSVEVIALAKIVKKHVRRTRVGTLRLCFEPHHAILIHNKDRFSYIDLCFHCRNLTTSSNIELTNMDFENGKWKEMKAFFIRHRLTYEIEDNH